MVKVAKVSLFQGLTNTDVLAISFFLNDPLCSVVCMVVEKKVKSLSKVSIIQLRFLVSIFLCYLSYFRSRTRLKIVQFIVDHAVNKALLVKSYQYYLFHSSNPCVSAYKQFSRFVGLLKFNLSGGVKP
ncbi:MAG: hypothetical protein ACJAUP_000227 [Cellvibrionaceae bacterium]|jgi:hypothetical protein